MTGRSYAAWLGRARAHRRERRPVDAMLCLRLALRDNPGGAEAHALLAEVLWELGRRSEAVESWRTARKAEPRYPGVLEALVEALLALGDLAGAEAAASEASAHADPTPRLALLRGITRLAHADAAPRADVAQSVDAIVYALQQDPDLIQDALLAGPLAVAIDTLPRDAIYRRLTRELGRLLTEPTRRASAPAALLVHLVEPDGTAGESSPFAAEASMLLARSFAPGEHDALRRLAEATRGRPETSTQLARRYADLCSAAFRAPMPLLWPRRTGGGDLRVLVLTLSRDLQSVTDAWNQVASTMAARGLDVTFVVLDEGVPSPGAANARADLSQAQRCAALDPDVLLDLVGMTGPAGPLLVQRPARAIWSVAALATPAPAPLVDVVHPTLESAMRELESRAREIGETPRGMPTARELQEMLAEGVRLHQEGELGGALDRYDAVLHWQPEHAPVLYLRGAAHRDRNEEDAAFADFLAATTAAPDYLDARVAAARAALALDRPKQAVLLLEAFAGDGSDHAPAWRTLGLAWLNQRNGARALAAFERALALDMTDGETHYNHGVALQMQRRYQDAARAYQRALAFRPDYIAADFNLGVIFQQQGNTDAAVAAYTEVIRGDRHHVMAYRNLGEVLFAAGRIEAWRENFQRFEASCPEALPLAVHALEVCQHSADFPRLARYLDGLRNDRFRAGDVEEHVECLEVLLYLLLFFDVEPELLHRLAHTYDALARRVYGEAMPRPPERTPGRVRIGYLSADLRNHVMGKMIYQAARFHDRTRFEVFFYSTSTAEDEWTARFRGIADHYEVLASLSDLEAAERIARDDIDLLVDLSTHTKGARQGILARKPARVQLTHVASAGTLGMRAIDFKLTDHHADLPENQAYMLEKLLPMDGCVYPYRHIEAVAVHPFHRDRLGIANDVVLIGAFVTPLKLSERCLALWSEVLRRAPRTRLVFSPVNAALQGSYVELAATAGIARERLLLLPQGRNDEENQARYSIIDFVLDPMPFGGVNGTLEALGAGVPVVTLCGRKHSERTSYSILANLGMQDTVAWTSEEYVELGVRLAQDSGFRAAVRERLKSLLLGSVLADMPAHTRHLEAAYMAALAERFPAACSEGAGS